MELFKTIAAWLNRTDKFVTEGTIVIRLLELLSKKQQRMNAIKSECMETYINIRMLLLSYPIDHQRNPTEGPKEKEEQNCHAPSNEIGTSHHFGTGFQTTIGTCLYRSLIYRLERKVRFNNDEKQRLHPTPLLCLNSPPSCMDVYQIERHCTCA